MSTSIDKKLLLKWAIAIIVPLCFLIPETTELYTQETKMFLLVTSLGIFLAAFELMSLMAIAMVFPIGYIMLKVASFDVVLAGWTNTVPLNVVGGYLLANVLDRIGLLKRIAYRCLLLTGGSYYGLLYGVFIAGLVINTITGGNAWIIMAAFTLGLCKSFKLEKSIDSSLIVMVGCLSAATSCAFLYTPYYMALLLDSVEAAGGIGAVDWFTFAWHMLPRIICLKS